MYWLACKTSGRRKRFLACLEFHFSIRIRFPLLEIQREWERWLARELVLVEIE